MISLLSTSADVIMDAHSHLLRPVGAKPTHTELLLPFRVPDIMPDVVLSPAVPQVLDIPGHVGREVAVVHRQSPLLARANKFLYPGEVDVSMQLARHCQLSGRLCMEACSVVPGGPGGGARIISGLDPWEYRGRGHGEGARRC